MLRVNGLTKRYEKIMAVDNMTFEIENGEICVLLGPNGAGKSTTIKSIAGLLKFDGVIEIDGHDNKSIEAKQVFGFIPETPALYESLTVWEHMEFIARAYTLGNGWEEQAVSILTRFEMEDKRDMLGKELSKGMQQKISIACALLIRPRIVMFDEPMIGLDPKAIKELKKVFIELKEDGCAVLISTHIIDSIKEVWDRVLIMDRGKVVLSRTRDELEENQESLEDIFFSVTEKEAGQ